MIALFLLLTLLLIPLTKIPVAIAMQQAGGYDNKTPREQQAHLEGWGQRALAAHQNAFEALPVFGLALLGAVQLEVSPDTIYLLGILFFVSRLVYQVCYLADWATLRSLSWGVGYLACLGLVVVGF